MHGVMATRDAQRMADGQGLDLVEISPNADPPVCKIMDFGKFRYEESIKQKQARKSQSRQQIKEIKFHASVDVHDLQTKMRHIRDFLADGDKVKITLQYRGRENAHKELGMEVITRVIKELEPVAVVEQHPRVIGRLLGCLLAPRPLKPGQTKQQQASQQPGTSAPRPPQPPSPVAAAFAAAKVVAPAAAPVVPAAPVVAPVAPAPQAPAPAAAPVVPPAEPPTAQ